MTLILNDASDFRREVIEGLVAAYPRYLERVPNASGVVRRGGVPSGQVGIVIGGGSGHYPLSAGLVGRGFADGAVLGDVFTSPSAEQIYRVAQATDGGAGTLLCIGNYTGDVINFGAAESRLRSEGIDCRTVRVTDDIASSAPKDASARRGIAGFFVVTKIAGGAAARGETLVQTERVARKANDWTRTLGVAFSGCTLPGQTRPIFELEEGSMAIGLGIHGEPGIRTVDRMTSKDLASMLVKDVLRERPDGVSGKAAVLLNGLGAVKYEELFVLWNDVFRQLERAGVQVVQPEVGEFVTSLDMAGCSLTVSWLDDELEALWVAPAETAAFRRGVLAAPDFTPSGEVPSTSRSDLDRDEEATTGRPHLGMAESSRVVCEVLTRMLAAVTAQETELGLMDAVAGDGDHGTGMTRGLRAACRAAVESSGDVGQVLGAAGAAWADEAGGTSGALWGLFLQTIGSQVGQTVPITGQSIAAAVERGVAEVQRAGNAVVGDKTMVDAQVPFATVLHRELAAGRPFAQAWCAAADAAEEAARATAPLRPRLGRARPLAERSIGTPDPGATSFALCARAAAEVLVENADRCGPAAETHARGTDEL